MNDNDCLGAGCNAALKIRRIHAQHVVDVAENGRCAEVDRLRNRAPVSLGRADDLITFAKTDGVHCGGQSHRTVAVCDTVVRTLPCSEFLLELFGDVGEGECAAFDDFHRCSLCFLCQNHLAEQLVFLFIGDHVGGEDGRAAENC